MQSRCIRRGEEEYPANVTFNILCPGALFVRNFVPLTLELIGLALVSQNFDLPLNISRSEISLFHSKSTHSRRRGANIAFDK